MGAEKVALVTGSSRGIGRAVAERLSREGFHLVINYRESADRAKELADELSRRAASVAVRADVADPAEVRQLGAAVREEFGRLDVLVNNAGATFAGDWRKATEQEWRSALDTNLTSVFETVREFSPLLEEQGGCIVNIGSTYGHITAAPIAAYSAAKAGVVALTRAFAKELAPRVRVNVVEPGNIDTDMTRAAGEELVAAVIEQTPLGRLGTAEEIAGAVAFLVSPAAAFITGQQLVVDGGHGLR